MLNYNYMCLKAVIILIFMASAVIVSCDAQEILVSNNVTYPLDHTIWVSDSINEPKEALVNLSATDLNYLPREPMTIILAIDCSDSMKESDKNRVRVDASKKFVDFMADNESNDEFGVVLWDDKIIYQSDITNKTEDVKNAIDMAMAGNNTCIWKALNASDALLKSATTQRKVVILFSDGKNTCEDYPGFKQKADKMNDAGIEIFAIGLGEDNPDLKQIGKYFHVKKPEEIIDVYEEIATWLKASLGGVKVKYNYPKEIDIKVNPSEDVRYSKYIDTINWPIGPMEYLDTKTLVFKVNSSQEGTYILANNSTISFKTPDSGLEKTLMIPTAEIHVKKTDTLFYEGSAIGGSVFDEFYPGYRINVTKEIKWSNIGCQDIFINITTPDIASNKTVVFAMDASGSTLHDDYEHAMMGGIQDALEVTPSIEYARVDWDSGENIPDYASQVFQSGFNWTSEWTANPLILSETDRTEYAAGLNMALQKIVLKKSQDPLFDRRIKDYIIILVTSKGEFTRGNLPEIVKFAELNGIPVYTIGLGVISGNRDSWQEASVLENEISNPTGGRFYSAGNRTEIASIVKDILNNSLKKIAVRNVSVIDSIYPYFDVLGEEPEANATKNPDGTTTVIFSLGDMASATKKSMVIHTAINISKIPIDVTSQMTRVDFSPSYSTRPSHFKYTSIVDNVTVRTKELPEGELSIYCGEPCEDRSSSEIDPAPSNCGNKSYDPAYPFDNNTSHSNSPLRTPTNNTCNLSNSAPPQANTSCPPTNGTCYPDNQTYSLSNDIGSKDNISSSIGDSFLFKNLSRVNITNGGDMAEKAQPSGESAVYSNPLRFEIPFVFQEGTKRVENLTSDEMLALYNNSSDLSKISLLSKNVPNRANVSDIFFPRIEPNDMTVVSTAHEIVGGHFGELSIDQIFSLYDYMRYGRRAIGDREAIGEWSYISDPADSLIDSYRFANETLKLGKRMSHSGSGDCDDFAIVMASLVRAIGGSSRIVVIGDENGNLLHAYTEVYLGILDKPDDDIYYFADLIRLKYNVDSVYVHIDPLSKSVWLNLDAPMDLGGKANPGCPFRSGSAHYILGPSAISLQELQEIRDPAYRSLLNIVNESLNSEEGNEQLMMIGQIVDSLNTLPRGNAMNGSENLTTGDFVNLAYDLLSSQGTFNIDMAKLALGNASTLPNADNNSTGRALNLAKLARMLDDATQAQEMLYNESE